MVNSGDQQWAKVSLFSIIEKLTTVFEHPDIARRNAERLAQDLHEKYNPKKIGRQLYQAIYGE